MDILAEAAGNRFTEAAARIGDDNLATYATRIMDNMLIILEERPSRTKEELDALGGVMRREPAMLEMGILPE